MLFLANVMCEQHSTHVDINLTKIEIEQNLITFFAQETLLSNQFPQNCFILLIS